MNTNLSIVDLRFFAAGVQCKTSAFWQSRVEYLELSNVSANITDGIVRVRLEDSSVVLYGFVTV
jgi:hypothetical protein